jgi:hypothetical protein
MAFFPPNYGDSQMYNTSRKSKNETPLSQIDEDDDSLTWYDAPQDLSDIHEAERVKDISKHSEHLKREKAFENKMATKDKYMKANIERLLRQNVEPRFDVPLQPNSWMKIDTSHKPGIGLLGKGEDNDYDVYDNDFHGGKKRKNKRSKKNKKTRKSKKTKKSKKAKKAKTSKQTRKRTRKF